MKEKSPKKDLLDHIGINVPFYRLQEFKGETKDEFIQWVIDNKFYTDGRNFFTLRKSNIILKDPLTTPVIELLRIDPKQFKDE